MESYNYKDHWDNVYSKSVSAKLGWYQVEATPSLEIIQDLDINRDDDAILVVGAGVTTLADGLIKYGYRNLIFSDISKKALSNLKERLKPHKVKFKYIVDDLTNPQELNKLMNITLWHDRAVLHFLTEEIQKQKYLALMHKVIKIGGYAIIATFSLEGAAKCSGLDVYRYSKDMLIEYLGKSFELIKSFDYTYIQPSGNKRPYIYTIFKKIA